MTSRNVDSDTSIKALKIMVKLLDWREISVLRFDFPYGVLEQLTTLGVFFSHKNILQLGNQLLLHLLPFLHVQYLLTSLAIVCILVMAKYLMVTSSAGCRKSHSASKLLDMKFNSL